MLNAQGDIVNGDKGTIQMTSIDQYNIAAELAGGKYGKYISTDGEALITLSKKGRTCTYAPVDTGFANKLCKELFCKSMKVPDSQNSLVRAKFLNGHVYVPFGQFGCDIPSYLIKSITKAKKGIYKVKAEIGLRYADPFYVGGVKEKYDRIGYTVVTLKKDNKAKHGYKVVKCSYRMLR